MSTPLTPPPAGAVAATINAVIRRVEHLAAGDDNLTRRALRLLTKPGPLYVATELDVVDAVARARAGEDLEGTLPRDVAATIDAVRDGGLEFVRRMAEDAARGAAEADEVTADAYRRYQTDARAQARTELAVRLAERGPIGDTIANLRREGYARGAEDLRAGLRLAAITALELLIRDEPTNEEAIERVRRVALECLKSPNPVEQSVGHRLREAMGPVHFAGATAREVAAGVIGGFLAEHNAPGPVELAGRLLDELERAGLAFTHRPTR